MKTPCKPPSILLARASDTDQPSRAFRTGKAPILVATGVSARGLDIRNVMHIINYNLPSTDHGGIDEYIHRIGTFFLFTTSSHALLTISLGRTARIGNEGLATSFYNDRDDSIAEDLVKILLEAGQAIPDFLEDRQPGEGENLDFADDTDDEGEGGNNAEGGEAWGSGGDTAAAPPPAAAPAPESNETWGAPAGSSSW